MKLIVLIFFSTIFFEGNPQLVRPPSFLSKLKGDTSNIEPYEIQSKKTTLLEEKKNKLKPEELIETQNSEKDQLIDENNSSKRKIKYKNNKKHILDDLTVHFDTENAFIDYEINDTIATQRQLIEIESTIIKPSKGHTNLLDFSLENETDSGESIENTSNTRRLLTGSEYLPIPIKDYEIPNEDANSFQNDQLNLLNQPSQSIELNNVNDNKVSIITNDANNDKSSSALNDLEYKIEDQECDDRDDNIILETAGIPTSGGSITDLVKSRMMLLNHPRTCYACNSNLDQSCWSPNRTTPVKYCRKAHLFCLTKFYQQRGRQQIIRDCGESCSSSSEVTCGVAYASCTICDSDLCNSAANLGIQSIVSIVIVILNIILQVFKPF